MNTHDETRLEGVRRRLRTGLSDESDVSYLLGLVALLEERLETFQVRHAYLERNRIGRRASRLSMGIADD